MLDLFGHNSAQGKFTHDPVTGALVPMVVIVVAVRAMDMTALISLNRRLQVFARHFALRHFGLVEQEIDDLVLIEPVSYTHLTLPTNREV